MPRDKKLVHRSTSDMSSSEGEEDDKLEPSPTVQPTDQEERKKFLKKAIVKKIETLKNHKKNYENKGDN